MNSGFLTGAYAIATLHSIGLLITYSLIAYAIARLHWHQRGFIGVLTTIIVAALLCGIPIWMGLGVIFCNLMMTAFAIVLFCQKAKRIPRQREDLARLDGCGWFGIYWHVLLPSIARELVVLGLLFLVGLLFFPFGEELCEHLPGWNNLPIAGMAIIYGLILTLPLFAVFLVAKRCS